jgi:hypothetical protein
MGVGLPLLDTLTIPEFRGVIAHEFGHYHGGDTALGPWIYKTRESIGRTVRELADHSAVLARPFIWYGNAFLRITNAISRRQEYAADALAMRIVGVEAMATGMRALHASGSAFDSYWRTELGPALDAGFRPPAVDGFRRFLVEPAIAQAVDASIQSQLTDATATPYDTHPSLRERLSALGASALPDPHRTGAPALSLLDNVDAVDAGILDHLARVHKKRLTPVAWGDVGEQVWIPRWRRLATSKAGRLKGLTPTIIGQPNFNFPGLSAHVGGTRKDASDAARRHHIVGVLASTLTVALRTGGWQLDALPGRVVTLTRNGVTLAPFLAVERLVHGSGTAAEWTTWCAASELADVDFSSMRLN